MRKKFIRKLVVIGVGLIGGSLARALKRARVVETVVGVGRSEERLEAARKLGVIDSHTTAIPDAVKGADMIVVATPLGIYGSVMKQLWSNLSPDAVVTDVGSAKGSVVAAARKGLGDKFPRFVPGHPIAGTEKSGVEASFAGLFEDHTVILTPLPETEVRALQAVIAMWEQTGAEVITMPVEHHDQVLAATSHLPHMLAYGLVDCLAQMQDREEIFRFAAGGFADFTRIASSNPEMWHDVCAANRGSLVAMIDSFTEHLAGIRKAIEDNDGARLKQIFARAKKARDDFQLQRENRKESTPQRGR